MEVITTPQNPHNPTVPPSGDGAPGPDQESPIRAANPVMHAPPDLAANGLRSLTPRNYGELGVFAIIMIILLCWHPKVGFVAFLYSFPIAGLLRYWWLNRITSTLSSTIESFTYGFVVMTILAGVMQWLLVFMALLLFGGLVQEEISFMLFCVVLVFACYTAPEEWLKIFFAKKAHTERVVGGQTQPTKKDLIMACSASLGYCMAQGIIWLIIVSNALAKEDNDTFGWVLWYGIMIALWGTPIHVASGYIIGLETMRQTDTRTILRKTTCIRGAYIYQLVLIMALGPIGVLLMMVTISAIYYGLFKHIKMLERTLPLDYIQRMGQLSVMGYGMLPESGEIDEKMEDGVR